MALRVKTTTEVKTKLSNTLRNWLPILHASLSDLDEAMAPFVEANPVIAHDNLNKVVFTPNVKDYLMSPRVFYDINQEFSYALEQQHEYVVRQRLGFFVI